MKLSILLAPCVFLFFLTACNKDGQSELVESSQISSAAGEAAVSNAMMASSGPELPLAPAGWGTSVSSVGPFTVEEYIELPEIGDTYQLTPVYTGDNEGDIEYWKYTSSIPSIVSVSDEGLIEVLDGGSAIVEVYVELRAAERSWVRTVAVAAGSVATGAI